MKVKMLVSRSGLEGVLNRGDVVDIKDAEAIRMIEAGQCEPVRRASAQRAVPDVDPERADG